MRWRSLVGFLAASTGLGLAFIGPRDAPAPRPTANTAFGSPRAPRAPAVVWAVGDGADGSAAARRVAARIADDRPDRVLYLGDVYERGSAQEFRNNFSSVYGRLTRRMAPTPGNHDWPAHVSGYDRYWQSVTGAKTPPWYAFEIGGWQLLSLNSETPGDANQLRWLRRRLLRTPGSCTIAFWHRPRFSAGEHGDQPDVAPLWDAVRGRAAIVLSGHDHDLQRMRPRSGTVQLVSGAGGHERYDVDADDPRLAFGTDQVDGALRMALRPGMAQISFVAPDGPPLDEATVPCQRAGR
jgi:hypothetical protein